MNAFAQISYGSPTQVDDAHAKKKAKKEKKEKKSKGDETVDAGDVTVATEADVTVAGDDRKKAKKEKKTEVRCFQA